ncbi:hypothetical protein DO021_05130 [Desulfobacter hydrogenophilus]|uniref:Uncharacterized protein n=1 Tax=Desulfobacter hydrogenophilus TaxID=2291 RepID=A0A328FJC2_9BACT|nr:hypothetical protein DO021_05130 [Desulfobacter hydrogenophilus]
MARFFAGGDAWANGCHVETIGDLEILFVSVLDLGISNDLMLLLKSYNILASTSCSKGPVTMVRGKEFFNVGVFRKIKGQ